MHCDHNIFAKAIQEKKKVNLTFYNNAHKDTKEGLFGPIFYSDSHVGGNSDCYYVWDFDSEADNNFLGLLPSRIVSMKSAEEPFDPVEFFTSKRAIMEEDRRSGVDRRCSTEPYNGPERRRRKDRRSLPER